MKTKLKDGVETIDGELRQRNGKAALMRHMAKLLSDGPQSIIKVIDHAPEKGKTFGADVIRITGSSEFVDAVLSRIADLVCVELGDARLAASWGTCEPENGGVASKFQCTGETVYLKMGSRSDDGYRIPFDRSKAERKLRDGNTPLSDAIYRR